MGIGEYDNYFYQNLFYKNETGPTSVKPIILDLIQYHKPEVLNGLALHVISLVDLILYLGL